MSDRTDLRLVVTSATAGPIGAGPVPVRLRLELDPIAGEQPRRLKVLIEARPLAKGEVVHDGGDVTVPPGCGARTIERELRLRPGIWQARVVVTDVESGRLGSVLHTFEVEAPADSRPDR
ncbi:MAG TPA: hypothetical protein VMT70_14190 [Vicinamibacteria bacterium]|nr:hypothetical protein [Vicinamibacteria bacterium]